MRILHLTTHLNIGGITTYIKRLIKPLKARGVETYVVTSGGERIEAFRNFGATVFELPIKTKSELHPKLWRALPKLNQIIRENKIDVLHAHTRVTQVLAAVASACTGIPVVTTCHGFYKRRLGRRLFPCWGKRVVAISAMVADQLTKEFKVSPERICLILNAVDVEELEKVYAEKDSAAVKKSYGFNSEDPVVGIVARLAGDKGHEYLIQSVPPLLKEFPNLRILIVGEGRARAQLEKLTANLNLQKHVHFTGNVVDITVPMAAMDVFALPATWREGFGLSIIEAMVCKKPVIVTNIWSLNTLIQDGKSGLMIAPKQIEPLSEAIRTLLNNPSLAQTMTQAAYALVIEEFNIPRMAREMHSLYQELCTQKRLTPRTVVL